MNGKITVLVVGAGPSGLTIATILAQQGVRVVIIDKKKRRNAAIAGGHYSCAHS